MPVCMLCASVNVCRLYVNASGGRERALDSLQLWLQELGVVPGD